MGSGAPFALTRRQALAAGLALAAGPVPAVLGRARPRLVVVGGGAAGATAARHAAIESAGALEVTLVEPKSAYVTCFHSNLYMAGLKPFESLVHGYDGLVRAGVTHVRQAARTIDRDRREVVLADGARLSYDRLILSPGIALDYDSVPGWGKEWEEVMPHAWIAGRQTQILHDRLEQVPDGGLIVIVAPPNPYRCPPAPYERASLMALRLKATGRGRAKIMIVDPKEKFSKQGLFQEGWESHYPGMIEWMDPAISEGVKSVDPKTGTVVTGFETYANAALVNVIPAQRAGAIAAAAGLTDATGWCPIAPESMASRLDPAIFIIGDAAQAEAMPKSAVAANSQGHVAAGMARAALLGTPEPAPLYDNACWSVIAADDAVKVSGTYAPAGGRLEEVEGHISQTGEPAALRQRSRAENEDWYRAITADMFG